MIDANPNLAVQVIANARRYATGKSLEVDGPNDGPEIREWLSRRGIYKPAAWCAAAGCAWIQDAAKLLKLSLHIRYSAGSLRFLDLNRDLIIPVPEIGCAEIEDHGNGLGHFKIVTGIILTDGKIVSTTDIAGNTSADGISRNGDRVAERQQQYPNPRLAGYVRIA